MAGDEKPIDKPIDLNVLLRRRQPPRPDKADAEARLDALLDVATRRPAAPGDAGGPMTPLDQLRAAFRKSLIPAFDEVRQRYEPKGIRISLSADDFLGGGRKLAITIEFAKVGLRMDGVVTQEAIAFNLVRYSSDDPSGLTSSGPTLRIRDLTAEKFQAFVCERMSALVQLVVARR